MNSKSKGSLAKSAKVTTQGPAENSVALKHVGGSRSDHWNYIVVNDTWEALWRKNSDEETADRQFKAAMAALIGIAPKDELEGMMAAQLIASHSAAMECYRRAMIGEQTFEGRRESLTQANKLSRTYAVLLDALNRHRGKGQQKVTVEHVHVHPGGQAVVGLLENPGGGDRLKLEDQPHAKQITHAPQPTMRSANAEREPMPVARDAEWSMPTPRRQVAGSTKGE